ncbi:MAG TPA: sigma-70 family RNA polymerase sigma factor [Chloroflexota bacterium]
MASIASEWVKPREQETSFERLFTDEYRTVVAVAYRVLADAYEAEDVAQEVFCQFYRRHSPESPWAAPWLYRAAAHTALNRIRGNKRRTRRESQDAIERGRLTDFSAMSLDPQHEAVRSEQRLEVRAALARLPEKSAAVLALRYSGLSYAEVAAALGVGIGQVGTLLRRAEAALRKEMTRETPR